MTAAAGDARALAANVVARVLKDGVTLDAALLEVLAGTDGKHASSVRSLSYGAVRGYFRHEALLGKLLAQPVRKLEPAVRALLSVALFELEDARTPEYAVVDAAVNTAKGRGTNDGGAKEGGAKKRGIKDGGAKAGETNGAAQAGVPNGEVPKPGVATPGVPTPGLAPRAGGLINAVLRRYLREREALDAQIASRPAQRHAAPIWLADLFRADWPVRWTQLLAASDAQAPMWLRVNARAGGAREYVARLEAAGMRGRAEPRVPYAVQLETPCDVQMLPGFAQGEVSVQDLGAQCVAFPLALAAGQHVLDACAAPGGKTALIAERQPNLGALVAVDVDSARLGRVRDNLWRGGLEATLVAADLAATKSWWEGKPYGQPFDRILLDAPCSALGVIRRHPDIRLRKSPAEIDKLPTQQRRLLAAAWSLLAPGGRLVYATCTVARAENRAVIGAFLATVTNAEVVPVDTWEGWPALGERDEFGVQILPGEAGADGFYYAALTKR